MATRLAYAAWCAVPALVVLSGQHRILYRALGEMEIPGLAVAALTGAANLAWHELAYAVGSGLKSARAFVLLPWVGAAAALGAAACAGTRFFRYAAVVQAAIASAIGGLALAVLAWRTVRGFPDPWRLVATLAFLAAQAAWFLVLLRRGELRRGGPK
jgi:hypothetical protein